MNQVNERKIMELIIILTIEAVALAWLCGGGA